MPLLGKSHVPASPRGTVLPAVVSVGCSHDGIELTVVVGDQEPLPGATLEAHRDLRQVGPRPWVRRSRRRTSQPRHRRRNRRPGPRSAGRATTTTRPATASASCSVDAAQDASVAGRHPQADNRVSTARTCSGSVDAMNFGLALGWTGSFDQDASVLRLATSDGTGAATVSFGPAPESQGDGLLDRATGWLEAETHTAASRVFVAGLRRPPHGRRPRAARDPIGRSGRGRQRRRDRPPAQPSHGRDHSRRTHLPGAPPIALARGRRTWKVSRSPYSRGGR